MNKKEKYFLVLRKLLGRKDHYSDRFIQELQDHLEDEKYDEAFAIKSCTTVKMSKKTNETKQLGKPEKLAQLYKKVIFPEKARRYFGIFLFVFIFVCSELIVCFFDPASGHLITKNFLIVVFSTLGMFFYFFNWPLLFFSTVISEIYRWIFNVNILTYWPIYRILGPFLNAAFYTFLYFVFACDPSIWSFKKKKKEDQTLISE